MQNILPAFRVSFIKLNADISTGFRLICLVISLLVGLQIQAVSYHFQHISSRQGLPHQQVEAMIQDGKGNIWFGTRNGLARYDGYTMHSYFHESGKDHSLAHHFIKALFLDHSNRIWICNPKGVSRYRPATDDFVNYDVPGTTVQSILETSKGKIICAGNELCVFDEKTQSFVALPSLGEGFIISIAIDRHDRLFVATNTSIYSYNSSLTKITRLDPKYYRDFITGADGIIPMMFDHLGRLWIGKNGNGVMSIDLKTGNSIVYQPGVLSNGTVRTIKEDRQHRILLGTEKGVTIIHPSGRIEILQQFLGNINTLSDNAIYSILIDKNDNIWIGSYFGGVDLLQNDKYFSWEEPGYGNSQLHGKVVRQMVETSPGNIWIASEDGGLNVFNRSTSSYQQFNRIPNLGTNVHSLYFDQFANDMWIGTFRHGLFRYNLGSGQYTFYEVAPGTSSNSIFDFARQKNGKLWIAMTQGLRWYNAATNTFQKSGNQNLDNTFIYCLATDQNDNLWAGTTSLGLYKIDAKTSKITRWKSSEKKNDLKDDYITCIFPAKDGKIWIGTNNNGLQILNLKTGVFSELEGELQLSRCTICKIQPDANGHIWISTSQGLFCYDSKNRAITHFTTDDGLPTNQFNFSSSLLSSSGMMYFGTVNGLISFMPSKNIFSAPKYTTHLKTLFINGVEMNAGLSDSPLTDELDNMSTIHLSYDQARSFVIDYGVISPGNVNSYVYQVWFEGIDKTWRDVNAEHRFVGYNLEEGKYILHVRANNSNFGWNHCPEKQLVIIVSPPFYRSFWAYVMYLIIFSILVYYLQRAYKQHLEAENKVKMAIMESEKVKEIDSVKFSFFTTVSHELKTPLSLIVSPLKCINKDNLNPDDKNYLELALKNTHKIELLVNELVTFNKVESDNFPFYIQKGNPLEFVTLLTNTFKQAARDKNLSLVVECEDNGEIVWFSPYYLESIVNNLLSNAIKFTPNGGQVKVKGCITLRPEKDAFTYLLIKITDTGIGIAKEEQANIFQRFYQTKRGYNANSSGWGIGLSLVKRLVNIHKGQINVESQLNVGSTFTVLLNVDNKAFDAKNLITDEKVIVPLKDYNFTSSMSDLDISNLPSNQEQDDTLSILIVEDNQDLLSFLAEYFSKKYHVFTAANGLEALNIAKTEPLQLIISDVMMPEMDGFTLCQHIKSEMETSHIPVILLTAKNEQEDVVAGYKSGAEAFVSKPFDPQILELQVNNILQLVGMRQKEIINTRTEDVDATSLGEIDKAFIQKINNLIDTNIDNADFSVADVTKELSISRSLLHIKMKSLVNMSIGEYIRHKRMTLSKRLLEEGYNVSETSYRTGFSDPNYFSKTFKKFYGMNPTEFIDNRTNPHNATSNSSE